MATVVTFRTVELEIVNHSQEEDFSYFQDSGKFLFKIYQSTPNNLETDSQPAEITEGSKPIMIYASWVSVFLSFQCLLS